MRLIYLFASAIGIIDVVIYGESMTTNHLISLCTCTIICYIIYLSYMIEDIIKKNNKPDETKKI
jgi:drug/metabolite transporter (DMT)-like permease